MLESSYDPNGNLEQSIDGKGQVTKYIYDLDDRLETLEYYTDLASSSDPANAQKTVTFSYDDLNQLTGYDDGSTSAVYVYDDAGQMTSSTVNYGTFSLGHS
ncbi:MAG: hypothetical protein GY821_07310, partial [Gammaproteobacteria bacterium]|nr:hypothetical protein [Gammaproteobacteria bacterium]